MVIAYVPTHDSDECLLGNRSIAFSKKNKKGKVDGLREERRRRETVMGKGFSPPPPS